MDTAKTFFIGFAVGSMISGYAGFLLGKRVSGVMAKPEFRIVMAAVILFVWSMAHILSFLTASQVDSWLNIIMGAVAGFFFGDGLVETYNNKEK